MPNGHTSAVEEIYRTKAENIRDRWGDRWWTAKSLCREAGLTINTANKHLGETWSEAMERRRRRAAEETSRPGPPAADGEVVLVPSRDCPPTVFDRITQVMCDALRRADGRSVCELCDGPCESVHAIAAARVAAAMGGSL